MSKIKYLTIGNISATEIERFFSKVVVNPITNCWLWAAADSNGYGQFWFRGERHYAHRFIYAWLIEPLPKTLGKNILQLDHVVCDNRSCVNPWHVKPVFPKQNSLRGNSPAAIHSRKTHCPRGHDYKFYSDGSRRYCPTCNRNRV